jgi:hypothetical protein
MAWVGHHGAPPNNERPAGKRHGSHSSRERSVPQEPAGASGLLSAGAGSPAWERGL